MRTPRRLLILLGLAALLLLGACSDDTVETGTSAGAGPTLVAPVPGPDTATSPAGGDANPGALARRSVTATPGLLNPVPAFIESFVPIDDSTVELRFTTGVEECYGLDRVDIEESGETVTVTLFTGSRPGADVCIEIAEAVSTKVTLPTPLGDRVLVDGSTGEPIPVD